MLISAGVTLASTVALIVTIREKVTVLDKRMGGVERKLDSMTPRLGEVERLRKEADDNHVMLREVRDALLAAGLLHPRRRSTRTPPTGMPAAVVSRESDEET